jgi:hypothetical protein
VWEQRSFELGEWRGCRLHLVVELEYSRKREEVLGAFEYDQDLKATASNCGSEVCGSCSGMCGALNRRTRICCACASWSPGPVPGVEGNSEGRP